MDRDARWNGRPTPPFNFPLRLIVVLNEKLLDVMGDDVTQDQAFAHANDVLKNAAGGISDIIHIPGLVNVDFEDVKAVMSEPGKAMMGTAVACPLLEGIDLSGASGVLARIDLVERADAGGSQTDGDARCQACGLGRGGGRRGQGGAVHRAGPGAAVRVTRPGQRENPPAPASWHAGSW